MNLYRLNPKLRRQMAANSVRFKFREGNIFKNGKVTLTKKHALIFVIEGEIEVKSTPYSAINICKGNMIFIAKGSTVKWLNIKKIKIIYIVFDTFDTHFHNSLLNECQKERKIESSFNQLKIKGPLMQYLDLLMVYLNKRINIPLLHEIKSAELFVLMEHIYTKKQLTNLLYTYFHKQNKFRDYITNNYTKISNVNELIASSDLSKTKFHEKFKQEFGISAKKWLIQQKIDNITKELNQPDLTIQTLVSRCKFQSVDGFYKFCVRHFGSAPKDLIKRSQKE